MTVRRVVPDLQAADPAGSTEFYGEVLGLEPAMDLGWIVTFAAPGNPSAQISVLKEDATAPVVPAASIEVEDVDAAYALCASGARSSIPSPTSRGECAASLFATPPARPHILTHPSD